MTRRDELRKIFETLDKDILTVVSPMIDDLIFIEEQLSGLKKYPFIKVHSEYPEIQKATPAGKLYKDLLSQEKDIVRILSSLIHKGNDGGEGDSALRDWLKKKSALEFR